MASSTRSTIGRALSAIFVTTLAVALTACSSSGGGKTPNGSTGGTAAAASGAGGGATGASAKPKRGGNLTVLVGKAGAGNWAAGLDPATNTTGSANATELQAIYGGLFLLRSDDDGSNAKMAPNLAASGEFSADLKTLTIKLRPGMTFSDGTPFNAQAVIWNLKRDFASKCCAPLWKIRTVDPFTSPDALTVQIHLAAPDASLLHDFPGTSANWIASPSAVKKMGEKAFRVKPVGAGPYVVVSDQLSELLVVKRNPKFYLADKGLPYLDQITFKSIGGGDQAAYQALLAGGADTYQGMSSTALVKQAQANSKLTVTIEPATQPYTVQLNTLVPPFNNKKAREALYYATNWDAILKGLFDGNGEVVQSFTTSVDLFYHQNVPGYRTYNLDKAKQLVQSIGGLSFRMFGNNTPAYRGIMTALQTQWQQAGMHVEIKAEELATELKEFNSGKWNATVIHAGDWDPDSGLGLSFRFGSRSPYTGIKDPKLDALLQQGATSGDSTTRDKVYQEVAKYLSDNAYAVFGLSTGSANVVVTGVHGPGLTTKLPGGLGLIPNWTETWRE
jgi:peptide/nickel transport system substrate-binding protein